MNNKPENIAAEQLFVVTPPIFIYGGNFMTDKKEITITGSAVIPITVGEVAFIAESDGSTRRTSVVVSIESNSDEEVRFETQNSIYTLRKTKGKPTAGIMIKKMFEMRGC